MSVILEISVPVSQFALGQLFVRFPDIEVEVERIVPMEASVMPLFWVEDADPDAVLETLVADEAVEEAAVLTETEGRYLFKVVWSASVNSVVQPLIESSVDVLRARGGADAWQFRLQFEDRDDVSPFRERCRANGVEFELDRLYNPTVPDDVGILTEPQRDIVRAAYSQGFWHVPRGVTLSELATDFGISNNAASQRLRRGLNAMVAGLLATDEAWEHVWDGE